MDIAKDGERVRVPLHLMDTMQRQITDADVFDYRPGYRTRTADAPSHDRAAARLQMITDLGNAWRTAGRVEDRRHPELDQEETITPSEKTQADIIQRQRDKSWRESVTRVENAWKGVEQLRREAVLK
jgi:hypothetical protein